MPTTITGTSGNDTLNGTVDDDVIDGLGGSDTLTGGVGWDVFQFGLASGNDTVTDYSPGEDWLDFSAYGFTTFAEVMNHAQQVGSDVVITLSGTDSITLTGIQLNWLRPADFVGVTMVPDYGSPPGPVNMTTPEYINTSSGNNFTIASGEYRYATNMYAMFYDTSSLGSFTNNGTIYWDVDYPHTWTFTVISTYHFTNNGKIVVVADQNAASSQDVIVAAGDQTAVNTGQIYAIATMGNASGLLASYSLTNSGLIAVHSDDGSATGASSVQGPIINQVGGQILAEGIVATAVSLGNPLGYTDNPSGDIQNAGLIEAHSLVPAVISTGIYLGHSENRSVTVINSGTIRADDAIYSDDYKYSVQVSMPRDFIINQGGGLIDGDIVLNRGDDSVHNSGSIIGDLVMGEGNDVVDTTNGTIDGIVDLGWGNDTFTGSAGADRVAGDDGNDTLTGNGGNDILLGGANDDTIVGGTGNDGLYGEYGNDSITTQAADIADGGAGNDRITLGDYTFAKVDGGDGTDTLVLASGARKMDLTAALATGRILNFETIELTGNKELVVRSGDVSALTGGGTQLMIDAANATDKIDLLGTWTTATDQVINGTTYHAYTSAGVTVLVDSTATVALGGSAPAGATGLDAIAAGTPAPVPGIESGILATPNELYVYDYEITQSLTVNPEETWWNDGYQPVLTDDNNDIVTLTNYGWIVSSSDNDYPFTRGIEAFNLEHIVNHGTISALSAGTSGIPLPGAGYSMDFTDTIVSAHDVINDGLIEAQAAYGTATALGFGSYWGNLINSGDIYAYADKGPAVAVDGVEFLANTGSIIAIGAKGATAVNLSFDPYDDQSNDGYIQATTMDADGSASIGIYTTASLTTNTTSFINNGTIVADIALEFLVDSLYPGVTFSILNNGELHGDVLLGAIPDNIINKGLITGVTDLATGDDVFDGSSGVQAQVWGGEGNDSITGGKLADSFFGDAGNDTLTGNAGDDFLEGGDGNDAINGGLGFDVASYSAASAGVVVSIALAGAQNTIGAGTDTLTAIEDLIGSAFNDRLTGDAAGNYLTGLGGNDLLNGGGGTDFLNGGEGSDIYFIGAAAEHGAAEIGDNGASGSDELRFAGTVAGTLKLFAGDLGLESVVIGTGTGASAVTTGTVALNVDARLVGNALSMTGNSGANLLQATAFADQLNGGAGDDTLYGFGGNDTLTGGTGADKMIGGTGDDTYFVDNAGDLVYENAGEGTDTVYSSAALYLRDNIENLILTGASGIYGKGNASANTITGNEAGNRLDGAGGDDTLIGNGGRDILDGGTGNDTLKGGADNDIYMIDSASDVIVENAGEGVDFVQTSVSYTLSANVERMYLMGSGNIDGTGNDLANLLVGNSGNNMLSGLGANDRLYGGAGNDTLNGGDANDYLEGGAGQDDLIGGAGKDYFVFRDGDTGSSIATADRIEDFALGDRISLSPLDANTGLAGNQAFSFIGAAAFTGVAGELRYEQISGNTYLSGDTNGDGVADFMINLDGLHTINASDLIL